MSGRCHGLDTFPSHAASECAPHPLQTVGVLVVAETGRNARRWPGGAGIRGGTAVRILLRPLSDIQSRSLTIIARHSIPYIAFYHQTSHHRPACPHRTTSTSQQAPCRSTFRRASLRRRNTRGTAAILRDIANTPHHRRNARRAFRRQAPDSTRVPPVNMPAASTSPRPAEQRASIYWTT